MAAAPLKPAKTRVKAVTASEIVDYVIEIEGWDWSYSLLMNPERRAIDPYYEFRHLQIIGRLQRPFNQDIREVEITLVPSSDLEPEFRKKSEPRSLGSFQIHNGRILGLVSIPASALSPILSMMIGERFKFIFVGGTTLLKDIQKRVCECFALFTSLASECSIPTRQLVRVQFKAFWELSVEEVFEDLSNDAVCLPPFFICYGNAADNEDWLLRTVQIRARTTRLI